MNIHRSCAILCFCLWLFLAIALYSNNVRLSSLLVSPNQSPNLIAVNSSLKTCAWKFDHYLPSAWENYWHGNIVELQKHICQTLSESEQTNKSIRALQHIIRLQQSIFNGSSPLNADDNELLSQMFYRMECSSTRSTLLVSQRIEPLIGLLRDPLTICGRNTNIVIPLTLQLDGEYAVQSKRFFLLAPSAPYDNFQPTTPIAPWISRVDGQKILFDVGSSFFNSHDNSPNSPVLGARWFYEYFRTKSLRFDRIIAFEYRTLPPKTVWEQLPDDVFPSYTFINVGVEKTGKFNPWHTLKALAKPHDYVVIKLDIDTPELESYLIQQIIDSKHLCSLIDEIFFEMHVTVSDMQRYWGTPGGQLKDSYDVFSKLRHLGIRMHSWP